MKTKKIVDGGMVYSVVEQPEWNMSTGDIGTIVYATQKIFLTKELAEGGKLQTLFHEIVHLADTGAHADIGKELGEAAIYRISDRLFSILAQNPSFLGELIELTSGEKREGGFA